MALIGNSCPFGRQGRGNSGPYRGHGRGNSGPYRARAGMRVAVRALPVVVALACAASLMSDRRQTTAFPSVIMDL
jgi:hypothetical protein